MGRLGEDPLMGLNPTYIKNNIKSIYHKVNIIDFKFYHN